MKVQGAYTTTIRDALARTWERPDGRWPWARWSLSLIVPVAILFWAVSLIFAPGPPPRLEIDVVSQTTGRGIPGALVQVGAAVYRADDRGRVLLRPQPVGSSVVASADGHGTVKREVEDADGEMVLSLSGVLVLGSVTDAVSGVPVEGAEITIINSLGEEVAATRTDESGTFVFTLIPENAELVLRHDVYGETREELGSRRELRIQLTPPPVTGTVVDGTEQPVEGVIVSAGRVQTQTDADGTFRLDGVGQGADLTLTGAQGRSSAVEVRGTDLGAVVLGDANPEAGASPESGAP